MTSIKQELFPKKENELSYQAVERFAKKSSKEELAKKITEIITSNLTDWEIISEIDFLCRAVLKG